MQNRKGQTAVITGAASGIGRALALKAASEGMNLAVVDMNPSGLESLSDEVKALGISITSRELDVSNAAAMNQFAAECFEISGTVDLLFNNAGILRAGNCWEQSTESWQRILSINVMGVVNGINAFVPRMLASGKSSHIVNTGSVGSLVAAPGMGQYTACKMAVRGITECLHLELQAQKHPIGVSLLCPGPVSTNIADQLIAESLGDAADKAVIEQIKEATVASDASFITPEICAARVFSAIDEKRFWIFTHPFYGHLKGLTQAVLNGDNPSYSDVKFD